jgi:N-acetylglucosamine-6-phosphate deacetylase
MPHYVDLQVNGYAGVDFNADALDAEQVVACCERLRREGVAGMLATIITDDLAAMCRRIEAIARLHAEHAAIRDIVWGVHVEGPFISPEPGYVGAHPAAHVRTATPSDADRLLDAGAGLVKLVTLAPERDAGFATTRHLAGRGIRVAAGHCNPTRDELLAAIDAGLTMFTHLGNGCPLMLHRHENIIQRALSLADRLQIGFIADGVHVPFVALDNYLRVAGLDRAFIVSDAIAAAGLGPGRYTLGSQLVEVDDNLATWAPDRSHLIGSACPLPAAAEKLQRQLGLSPADIERLMWDSPCKAMGFAP